MTNGAFIVSVAVARGEGGGATTAPVNAALRTTRFSVVNGTGWTVAAALRTSVRAGKVFIWASTAVGSEGGCVTVTKPDASTVVTGVGVVTRMPMWRHR